jgi:hypothetical protein
LTPIPGAKLTPPRAPSDGHAPTVKFTRILVADYNHFVSFDANCEGTTMEASLGYVPIEPAAVFCGADTDRRSSSVFDWDAYYWKATCDINEAALGFSKRTDDTFTHALLCKNIGISGTQVATVTLPGDSRRYSRNGDWDVGYWKLECGLQEHVTGASQAATDSPSFHRLQCSTGGGSASNCETRIVDGGAGYTGSWGDWDTGYDKADCPSGKVVVGTSFNPSTYRPHAIYCCNK